MRLEWITVFKVHRNYFSYILVIGIIEIFTNPDHQFACGVDVWWCHIAYRRSAPYCRGPGHKLSDRRLQETLPRHEHVEKGGDRNLLLVNCGQYWVASRVHPVRVRYKTVALRDTLVEV